MKIAMNENNSQVLGFQFEPERTANDELVPTFQDVDEHNIGDLVAPTRLNVDGGLWCLCDKCERMPSEVECFCCHETDSQSFSGIFE